MKRAWTWIIVALVAVAAIVAVIFMRKRQAAQLAPAPKASAGSGSKHTVVGKLVNGGASLFGGSQLGQVFDFAGQFTK